MAKKSLKKKPAAAPSKAAKKPAPKVAKVAAKKNDKRAAKLLKSKEKATTAPKKAAVSNTAKQSKSAPKPSLLGKVPKEETLTKELAAKAMTQSPVEVLNETPADPDEIILTDAEGRRYCRARDCDQLSRVDGYCRYHYLLFWKKIQVRKKILSDGKLERYVEELTSKYPDKFLETLRKDLRSEKDFMAAIGELELEEAANNEEGDFEDDNNFIEEMRGVSSSSSESTIQDDDDY